MPANRDKLELRLIEETIFRKFRELFSKCCNRRRSDLPQYKTPAFTLDPSKLAEIFNDCKDDPSPALLMDAVEFRSPLMEKLFEDYYETLSHHLLDCFKAARQQLRIDKHIEKLVGQSVDTLREHEGGKAKASPELQGVKAQITNLPQETSSSSQKNRAEFNLQNCGGKELCIIVSYRKAGKRDPEELAKLLTHKAQIRYKGKRYPYKKPLQWCVNNRKGFIAHTHKMRKKAEEKGWWDTIPAEYHRSYT